MAPSAKKTPPDSEPETTVYDVCSVNTNAQVVIGLDTRAAARDEAARLNAEAKARNHETGKPVGMERGKVTRYEVQERTIRVAQAADAPTEVTT